MRDLTRRVFVLLSLYLQCVLGRFSFVEKVTANVT